MTSRRCSCHLDYSTTLSLSWWQAGRDRDKKKNKGDKDEAPEFFFLNGRQSLKERTGKMGWRQDFCRVMDTV